MWQPEPGWQRLPGGAGPSTYGVWCADLGGRTVAVKRLLRPAADDPPALGEPQHFSYWRREADVALAGVVTDTPGLRGPVTGVEEDPDGVVLTSEWVEEVATPGLFRARALGEFAAATLPESGWLARRQLSDRMARVAERGGWRTLEQTAAAPVVRELWALHPELLDDLARLPQVPQHGDPTRRNLRGRDGGRVLALDWGSLGTGPVGADLGLLLLSGAEELDPLLDAYCDALPDGTAQRDEVACGARVSAVLTGFSRAERALARAAEGEGALEVHFRHPSVAPHLRALQRLVPLVEQLLGH